MKYFKYTVVFLIVFFIDANLLDLISIKGITPNIILVFLIFLSLRETQMVSTLSGFGSGLFQDFFTMSLVGLSSLSYSISSFLASFFRKLKGAHTISQLALIFFLITIIHDRIYQFIFLLGTNQQFFKSFFRFTLPKAVYTTVFAIMINFLFSRLIWQTEDM